MIDYEYYEMLAFLDKPDTLTKKEIEKAKNKALKFMEAQNEKNTSNR